MDEEELGEMEKVAFKSKSSIISSLAFYSSLMKTRKWTDCVLVGGDGVRVPAHMLMLAAHSSYLAQLFKLQRGHEEVCLVIPSLPGRVIEDIVGIMYGEIAVDLWGAGGKRILEAAQLLGCHYIDQPEAEDLEELDEVEEQPEIVELLDRDLAEHLYQDVAHVAQQLGEVVEHGEDWDLFQHHLEKGTEENDFTEKGTEKNDFIENGTDETDFIEKGIDRNDFTENEIDENDFMENDFTEKEMEENDFTEKEIEENDFTEKEIEENDFTEKEIEENDFIENEIDENDFTGKGLDENDFIENGIRANDFVVIKDESEFQGGFFPVPCSVICSSQLERSSVIVSTNKIKTTLCILEEKEMKSPSVSTQKTFLSPKDDYFEAGNPVAMTEIMEIMESNNRRALNRRQLNKRRDIQLPGLPPDSHQSAINEITILCSEHIQPRRRRLLRLALTCKGCNKVFMSGSELEEHVRQDHGEEGDMYRCVLHCNVAFRTFALLCHHSAMVHKFNLDRLVGQLNMDQGGDKKEFKCRLCGEKFMYGRGLQRHFCLDHDGELPFECGFCGHQTSEISRYNRHLICHQVARQREYCDICFKEFRNKVSLKTHRNMVHKLGKKYPCSHCDKVLYSSQYLKKHEATHEGIRFREVICKYCGKSIEYSKIKNHELTHTGEKPFQCPECNYRCIQRSNLRIHMKGVHGTELPRLALGQKRYSGKFMDGTAGNTDPFDLRSIFHNKSL